jgi:hypothetical protein
MIMKITIYTVICIAGLVAGIFYSASQAAAGPEADYFKRVATTRKS